MCLSATDAEQVVYEPAVTKNNTIGLVRVNQHSVRNWAETQLKGENK